MPRIFLLFIFLYILPNNLIAQDSLNLKTLGQLPYSDITTGQKLNDIWGYVDEFGTEYALVGLKSGVSIASIDKNGKPKEIKRIPGPLSTWRDLKTFNDFAFVVHDFWLTDMPQGLLVIDLRDIENGIIPFDTIDFNGRLERSHNIYIDENGIAYLTGSNFNLAGVGGALMLDVNDPFDIKIVGNFTDVYFHDCVTRGDTMWGGAINEGALVAMDVSNKRFPKMIGYQKTPNLFTHNCWFSDDGNYIFTTDEKSNATVASYDVSDISNIKFLDKIQSHYSDLTIPHNTHFLNKYLITSYYRDGLQIVDAQYPDNLIDVGHYDTSPEFEGDGFNGAWGAYPYLPSGRILVSDIENGLFVMEPSYKRGSYLEVTVIDSVTREVLYGAEIDFLNKTENLGVSGVLKTGAGKQGIYDVKASFTGYVPKIVDIELFENKVEKLEITLNKYIPTLGETDINDLNIIFPENKNVVVIDSKSPIKGGFFIMITNMLGQVVLEQKIDVLGTNNEFALPEEKGIYIIDLLSKGKKRIKQSKYSN